MFFIFLFLFSFFPKKKSRKTFTLTSEQNKNFSCSFVGFFFFLIFIFLIPCSFCRKMIIYQRFQQTNEKKKENKNKYDCYKSFAPHLNIQKGKKKVHKYFAIFRNSISFYLNLLLKHDIN